MPGNVFLSGIINKHCFASKFKYDVLENDFGKV